VKIVRGQRRRHPIPLLPREAALEVIGDYGAAFELEAQCRFDELYRHFEQRLRERDELIGRSPQCPSSIASVSA